jgi:hypothetical protein
MSTSTLTREQKVEFILAIRGIGIADNFIRSEYWRLHHENRIYIRTTYRISGECPCHVKRSYGHHSR